MGKKRLFIVVLLTAVTLFFLKNLYIIEYASDENIGKNARIDIFFAGDKDNQIFWEENANKQMKFQRPSWFKNPKWMNEAGNGIVIEYPISDNWKKDVIQLKLQGKGTLKLYFRAQDYKNVQIKYKNAIINGKDIFSGTKFVSFKNFYSFNEENASQYITLSIQSSQIKTQYDFAIFFSLLILCFIFYYKIIQYLAKFKIIEHNSRIDIVFLSVFFALLLLPISHIEPKDKSEQENRMLAKYIPLIDGYGHLNLKYGKNFEEWFNDRFNFRKNLLNLYTSTLFNINEFYQNSSSIRLKDNWLFQKDKIFFQQVSDSKLMQIEEGLQTLKDFCDEENIKCYVEIAPRRLNFAKNEISKIISDRGTDIALTIKQRFSNIVPIIYPMENMKKASTKDMVYFKTDHHWTEWGAYIGYQTLIKEIQKDFPKITPVLEEEYNIFYDSKVRAEIGRDFLLGHICKALNFDASKCVLETKYRYYQHRHENILDVIRDNRSNKYFKYKLSKNPQKAVVIGNSFTENFVSFWAYTFAEVNKYRVNNAFDDNLNFSRWKNEIKEFRPNILVIVIESEYSSHLSDLKD